MSNRTLQQFEADLKMVMGGRDNLRPFICEGSPLECRIFIVGFNPATELQQTFWHFWKPEYGFDRPAWCEVYKVERQQKPLALGKTRRHTLSNTRRVIEWIVEAAKPAKCLETNLYARATAQSADLQATDRDAKIFEYLLSAIRPKVVLVHGRDAAQHVEAMCGVHLEINTSAAIPLESAIVHVTAVPHLSRGWSKTRAKAVGEQLREASKSVGLTMRCSRAPLAAGA